eukprot:1195953-Prorocentrum_minimum.AAC.5
MSMTGEVLSDSRARNGDIYGVREVLLSGRSLAVAVSSAEVSPCRVALATFQEAQRKRTGGGGWWQVGASMVATRTLGVSVTQGVLKLMKSYERKELVYDKTRTFQSTQSGVLLSVAQFDSARVFGIQPV